MADNTNAAIAVYRGEAKAGTITRMLTGSVFEYDDAYYSASEEDAPSIAYSIPKSQKLHEAKGVNILPFFVNLLPEGWALQTVSDRIKASKDDLLSLLVVLGRDTIGDVWIESGSPVSQAKEWNLKNQTFDQILQEQYGDVNKPIEQSSIPGVQDKVSASRITIPGRFGKGAECILKMNRNEDKYPRLIENEHFFMNLASMCGIVSAETKIVRDQDGNSGLLVKRFDRVQTSQRTVTRIHVEDGCQVLGAYPSAKYSISSRHFCEALKQICPSWRVEVLRYIVLFAFNYIIGNGDCHAKNVSVIEPPGGLRRLSPAYDILSTLPYGDDHIAMKMSGRDANFRGRYLVEFGEMFGVRAESTRYELEKLVEVLPTKLGDISSIGFSDRKAAQLQKTISERIKHMAEI